MILKSGRGFDVICDTLGLDPDCKELHEGFDSTIDTCEIKPMWEGDTEQSAWTMEERREVADEMIRRWNQWASLPSTNGE